MLLLWLQNSGKFKILFWQRKAMAHYTKFLMNLLPALCVALSGITFGTIGYFGIRLFEAGFSVSEMLFWRFIIAAFCLVFLIKIPEYTKTSPKALFSCFLLGGIFYSLSTFCFFTAIPHIGTGIAMVTFYLFPILVALLNWLIDKRRFSWLETAALGLIIPGVVLLSITDDVRFNAYGMMIGLGSAVFYGIYFYASKKSGNFISPVLASLMVCLGNAFFYFLACLKNGSFYPPYALGAWIICLGFSLIGTALPLWLLFVGLKHINVTKAALISVLEPISTLVIGVIALNELLSVSQIIGIIVILVAALIVQIRVKKQPTSTKEY